MGDGSARLVGMMRDHQAALTSQRDAVDSQLSAIDAALSAMAGTSATRKQGRKRRRPKGKMGPKLARGGSAPRPGSLKEHILNVLRQRGSAMGPADIAAAVRQTGYSTTSKDLSKVVTNTLRGFGAVRRVGRGLYRA